LLITFLCLVVLSGAAFAGFPEEYIIRGTVLDSVKNEGIQDVNVFLRGYVIGTTTDKNGKFRLGIRSDQKDDTLVFRHIAYREKVLPISYFNNSRSVYLLKWNIPLGKVEVKTTRKNYKYPQEITNSISIIDIADFNSKGYIDVADMLMADQSVIIDENSNGEKTISVRGSNEDEVMILYDGIKLNDNFDNIFDVSLIDPSGIEQVNIIKGNNLAGVGGNGSSATINFIPKIEQDYLLSLHQRMGTYNSGDWGVNLYKNLFGLKLFAGMKKTGMEQNYDDESNTNYSSIKQTGANETVNVSYDFKQQHKSQGISHTIRAHYLKNKKTYNNYRDSDELSKKNEIYSAKYLGSFGKFGEINISASNQVLNEEYLYQKADSSDGHNVNDNTVQLNCEYNLLKDYFNVYAAYKSEESLLDFCGGDEYSNLLPDNDGSRFLRHRNEYSATLSYISDSESGAFHLDNMQFSLFFDRVEDQFPSNLEAGFIPETKKHGWHNTSYMFSSQFCGGNDNILFKSHFNYSVSCKIPTLYQQLSAMLYPLGRNVGNGLLTEQKTNQELGISVYGNLSESSETIQTEASLIIFHSAYQNKFRMMQKSGTPIMVMDNYNDADIYGMETYLAADLYKMLGANLAYIYYIIPDKAAFPFKPEKKLTATLTFSLKGFSIDCIAYQESEQVGWIINRISNTGEMKLQEIILKEYNNIDVHIKQSINIWRLDGYLSLSGRNIINKTQVLDGIAIRDRRFYITFGVNI